MPISSSVVSVTSTATALVTVTDRTTGDPKPTIIVAPSAGVFVGGSNVTTVNGFPIAANTPISFDLAQGDSLFGIVAAGSISVNVLTLRT